MKKKNKKNYKYLVIVRWSEEDQAFVAEVPELPGCATHADSFEEATHLAQDAIASWIEGAKLAGNKIPEPATTTKYSGKFVTRIHPQLHRALALKSLETGKSLNRLVEETLKEAVFS